MRRVADRQEVRQQRWVGTTSCHRKSYQTKTLTIRRTEKREVLHLVVESNDLVLNADP